MCILGFFWFLFSSGFKMSDHDIGFKVQHTFINLLFCHRGLFKCSVKQSHSGWVQRCLWWKGLLLTFSHRQTKLVSLVPGPCQRQRTIPGRLAERKFENTIWAKQQWIKQVLLSSVKSIEIVVHFYEREHCFQVWGHIKCQFRPGKKRRDCN